MVRLLALITIAVAAVACQSDAARSRATPTPTPIDTSRTLTVKAYYFSDIGCDDATGDKVRGKSFEIRTGPGDKSVVAKGRFAPTATLGTFGERPACLVSGGEHVVVNISHYAVQIKGDPKVTRVDRSELGGRDHSILWVPVQQ